MANIIDEARDREAIGDLSVIAYRLATTILEFQLQERKIEGQLSRLSLQLSDLNAVIKGEI